MSERLEKFPTSTSSAATAIACGPGPTGMAAPGCMVETSIGVTALLPKSATNAVATPVVPTETVMATGSLPTVTGRPGPPRTQVDRGDGVRIEVGHQGDALALGPAWCHSHRVGLEAHLCAVHHGMGRRVDLPQMVVPLVTTSRPAPLGA